MTPTNDQPEAIATFYARLETKPQFDGHPFDNDARRRSLERRGESAAQWLKAKAIATEIEQVKATLKDHLTAMFQPMGYGALRDHTELSKVTQAALDELRR
jgi:hypothetical protein